MQAANQRNLVPPASHQQNVLANLNARAFVSIGLNFPRILTGTTGFLSQASHCPRRSHKSKTIPQNHIVMPLRISAEPDRPRRSLRATSMRQVQFRQAGHANLAEATPNETVTRVHRDPFIFDMNHDDLLTRAIGRGPRG
jgi:hypothetical protein